jgi:glyceraldehyde 3-phosphate dehydrogenase
MPKKIAINGFGRIGRIFMRQALEHPSFEIVAVNDLGDIQNLAYLFAHDSVYGKFRGTVEADEASHSLVINGTRIAVLQEKDPVALPWKKLGIDVVVESTGAFDSFEKANAHIQAGARHAVLSAPAKDGDGPLGRTIIIGVNDHELGSTPVTSNASCTTNAIAAVMRIMADTVGFEKAVLNTTHAYTATQSIVDSPVKGSDFRRGRAGAHNMGPSSTGAALAAGRVIKEAEGLFDGIAVRVPVVAGSIADVTFVAKRPTSSEEVNELLRSAAREARWEGILKVSDDQLVSTDIIGEPYAAIVDARSTRVVGRNLVKILCWYDNEYGYVSTLVKHIDRIPL